MHIMETMVSPNFLDRLEDFMIVSLPKLSKLSQEFGESKTQYRVGGLATHCPEVELEVIVGFKKYLNFFYFFFIFSLVLAPVLRSRSALQI